MRTFPLSAATDRMVQFVEAWPLLHRIEDPELRAETLRRTVTLDEADERLLLDAWNTQRLAVLWAGACLYLYGTPAAIEAAPIPAVAPGDYEAASANLWERTRRLTLARRAEGILRLDDWTWDPEDRQVKAAPAGNRRKQLNTKMIELAYREMAPQYRKATGDKASNPRALQDEIAYALRLFFPPDQLDADKIRNAVDNYRRLRR